MPPPRRCLNGEGFVWHLRRRPRTRQSSSLHPMSSRSDHEIARRWRRNACALTLRVTRQCQHVVELPRFPFRHCQRYLNNGSRAFTRETLSVAPLFSLGIAICSLFRAACAPAISATAGHSSSMSPNMSPGERSPIHALVSALESSTLPPPGLEPATGVFDATHREVRGNHRIPIWRSRSLRDPGQLQRYQVWISPIERAHSQRRPYLCPASQSDVSVFRNLLFVSGEGNSGRLDCGTQA